MSEPITVRGVSDTARWVAYFRALETRRPDALFHDPYAERLAGDHGFRIANTLIQGNKQEWACLLYTSSGELQLSARCSSEQRGSSAYEEWI